MSVKETAQDALAIMALSKDRAWCFSCSDSVKYMGHCVPDIKKVKCLDCIERMRKALQKKGAKTPEDVAKLNENP